MSSLDSHLGHDDNVKSYSFKIKEESGKLKNDNLAAQVYRNCLKESEEE